MKDGALQFLKILMGEVFICKSSLRKKVLAGEGGKLFAQVLKSSPHFSLQVNFNCIFNNRAAVVSQNMLHTASGKYSLNLMKAVKSSS